MIKDFKDKQTELVWKGAFSKRLPESIQSVARRKLRMLNNAASLNDLRIPPANHLERLKGRRAGQYSIRINEQWRICFHWKDQNAYCVEIIDYH